MDRHLKEVSSSICLVIGTFSGIRVRSQGLRRITSISSDGISRFRTTPFRKSLTCSQSILAIHGFARRTIYGGTLKSGRTYIHHEFTSRQPSVVLSKDRHGWDLDL